MTFSVGVLYSAREFTAYIAANQITLDDFKSSFQRFSLAKSEDILSVSLKCKWIDLHPDGICRITPQGKKLLEVNDLDLSLRLQICDLIHAEEPSWASKIPDGRKEALSGFPDEVHQCFYEAGLLEEWDDDLIKWWDELSIATRVYKSRKLLDTGRKAERETRDREAERTGIIPKWVSLNTNFAGYDILSCRSKTDLTPRKIEVKGTVVSLGQAYFTLSRNEWRVAQESEDYRLHLWCFKSDPYQLIEVTVKQLKKHIPKNRKDGAWETVRIPFKSFI